MQNAVAQSIVILGTGGTIAGSSAQSADNVGYRAGTVSVEALLAELPALQGRGLEAEQVAQLDSKDMDHATWAKLARSVARHLARPEVKGVLITHGTDTLEETAYFLQRLLAPAKPVVLTAAMRPATALLRDGPQNLLDAVALLEQASALGVGGVSVVLAGRVHAAAQVQKAHSYQVDAFRSRDGVLIGTLEEGRLRQLGPWSEESGLGLQVLPADDAAWPRVEIVLNHAGADGRVVEALMAQGVDGLVVAGTGNGTISAGLESVLLRAQSQGVAVLRATRCESGAVVGDVHPLRGAGALSAVKARVELLLTLLARA